MRDGPLAGRKVELRDRRPIILSRPRPSTKAAHGRRQFIVRHARTSEHLARDGCADDERMGDRQRPSCRRRCPASVSHRARDRPSRRGCANGRRCGASRHDIHARLRAGVTGTLLRGGADCLSSATLRRSASIRLITRRGVANIGLGSFMMPACLALRCASSASS